MNSPEQLLPTGLSVEEEISYLQSVMGGVALDNQGSVETTENIKPVTIQEALATPLGEGTSFFRELLTQAQNNESSFLVIVNDSERATKPTQLMLAEILPALFEKNIPLTLAVATGTHVDPTDQDLEKIFGTWLPILRERKIEIITNQRGTEDVLRPVPDPTQEDGIAKTVRGTRVRAHHRLFVENQIVIALNSIEPHPRAGFTGGTKSFWPGMGTAPDIMRNHSMVLLDGANDVRWNDQTKQVEPLPGTVSQIGPLSVAQNPERQDMTEVVNLIDRYRGEQLGLVPFHSLNVVMDPTGERVVSAGWGKPETVSTTLNPVAAAVYSYPAKAAETIILEVPDPQGETLEQVLKSFAFISEIVSPQALVILVASFLKGAGSPHFVRNFEGQTTASLRGILDQDRRDFTQAPSGIHAIPSTVKILERAREVMLVPRQPLAENITSELQKYPIVAIQNSIAAVLKGINLSQTVLITNSTMMVPRSHQRIDRP